MVSTPAAECITNSERAALRRLVKAKVPEGARRVELRSWLNKPRITRAQADGLRNRLEALPDITANLT